MFICHRGLAEGTSRLEKLENNGVFALSSRLANGDPSCALLREYVHVPQFRGTLQRESCAADITPALGSSLVGSDSIERNKLDLPLIDG